MFSVVGPFAMKPLSCCVLGQARIKSGPLDCPFLEPMVWIADPCIILAKRFTNRDTCLEIVLRKHAVAEGWPFHPSHYKKQPVSSIHLLHSWKNDPFSSTDQCLDIDIYILFTLSSYQFYASSIPNKGGEKMNGYSKIREVDRRKSRSVDFSELALSPAKIQQPQISNTSNRICEALPDDEKQQQQREEEERGKIEEDVGTRFGAILSRNCSVSSTTSASKRFSGSEKNPQHTYGVQSTFKRAFSLGRSSSVSEGYCRIHDQWDPLSPPPLSDAFDMQMRSGKNKKKRGSFLKACKRLFGFS